MHSISVELDIQEPKWFFLFCKGFGGLPVSAWSPLSLPFSYVSLSLSSTYLHSTTTGRLLTWHHVRTTFSVWKSLGRIFEGQIDQFSTVYSMIFHASDLCPGSNPLRWRRRWCYRSWGSEAARPWWPHDLGWGAGGGATVGISTANLRRDNKDAVIPGFRRLPLRGPFVAAHARDGFMRPPRMRHPSPLAPLRSPHPSGCAVFQLLNNRCDIPTNGVQLAGQMTMAKEDLRECIHLASQLT